MILIDGKLTSEKRQKLICERVKDLVSKTGKKPGLVALRVGLDPASEIYVKKKVKTCIELGLMSREVYLSETTSKEEILKVIDELNHDSSVNGILVQLPLPKHLPTDEILERVLPEKDVDGFHPLNVGNLLLQRPCFKPCTPLGIMTLLSEYNIPLVGKKAVVIGRSRTVGRPMSILLDLAGATVTVVHLQTENPKEIFKSADILVAAAGRPHLIHGNDIKPGATVIDVGIHRNSENKIIGDVHFESAKLVAGAITPVPGGVGPMTICSLIENTVESFIRANG